MPAVPVPSHEPLTAALARDLDAAFAAVVDVHGGAVYSLLLRASGSPYDAEDLAQETFLAAYSALRRQSAEQVRSLQLRPWLLTIATNLLRNEWRRRARRPRTTSLPSTDAHIGSALRERAEAPEEAAVRRDGEARLARLLVDLPEGQRLAVVLRHVVGLSYAEVAATLDVPVGTAKGHTHRGLRRLRQLLESDPLDPEEVHGA